jgi:hypothetical protein
VTPPKQIKEGRVADDETVRRVDAVLCEHLDLWGNGRGSEMAYNLSRQCFNISEAEALASINDVRDLATRLAGAPWVAGEQEGSVGALSLMAARIASRGVAIPRSVSAAQVALSRLLHDLSDVTLSETSKPRAKWVADQAAALWEQRFGQRPGVSVRKVKVNRSVQGHDTAGDFVDFVAALYNALGIEASAKSQAQTACERLRTKSSPENEGDISLAG